MYQNITSIPKWGWGGVTCDEFYSGNNFRDILLDIFQKCLFLHRFGGILQAKLQIGGRGPYFMRFYRMPSRCAQNIMFLHHFGHQIAPQTQIGGEGCIIIVIFQRIKLCAIFCGILRDFDRF